jgi:hypothetical protein
MLAAVWTLTCVQHDHLPRRSVGATCSLMDHAQVAVSIAPAIIQGTGKPSGVSGATKVLFLPCLRGTDPVARRSCGAAVQACQGGVGAALVDQDELRGVARRDRLAPGRARLLVALAGCQALFVCVQPSRRIARHIVASLSCRP